MTEKQWDEERWSAQGMVLSLSPLRVPRTKSGRRKLRLFACGCVRVWWKDLIDSRHTDAVDVSESFAEGLSDREHLAAAYERAGLPIRFQKIDQVPLGWRSQRAADMAAETCHPKPFEAALMMIVYPLGHTGTPEAVQADGLLCDLLRCVFGNPFQKPTFSKKWRTETVTALAAGIYEERAFDRLPILADALEETGCDDPAMLKHLRGDGPHCRGC